MNSELFQIKIIGNPSQEAWGRVWRYATWMREVGVGYLALEAKTLQLLLLKAPPGGWFQGIRYIDWDVSPATIPYAHIFFSPQLKTLNVYGAWHTTPTALELSNTASVFSQIPASALQTLTLRFNVPTGSSPDFDQSLRSVVLRCGSSLTQFTATIPLSDAAVNHLFDLPHLKFVKIADFPPPHRNASFPKFFPPLTALFIIGRGAGEWNNLFIELERGVSAAQQVAPLFKMKESLRSLWFKMPYGSEIGSPFTVIRTFRNLSSLDVDHVCDQDYQGLCSFKMDDSNVAELAATLPHLRSLILGSPCSTNTCATTVACLLQLSVRCPKLEALCIHFNTTNIVNDLEDTLYDPRFQELRSLPRCSIERLTTGEIPLFIDEPGLQVVEEGLVDIFPNLVFCDGSEEWRVVAYRITARA